MKTALRISMAVLLLAGCGSKDKPIMTLDVGDTGTGTETVDGGPEVCTASCEGKECGSDGCKGDCGTCNFGLETCSDDGLCVAFECTSTKDCPGELVCAKDIGACVICVGDEDCPEGQTCGGDHFCHTEIPCLSDKDCKDHGMVCDKDAGICVQCLTSEDCKPEEYCLDTYCIDDICTAGEAHCNGLDIIACNEEGSAEGVTETCTDTQYCEAGQCHAQVCPPGKLYCEDNLLLTCDTVGKEVIDTVDCEDDDKVCYQGECTEQNCEPGSTWCHDDFTAAACLGDGMSSTTAPCGADHYCEDGACEPQVCDPGSVFCDGEVYKVCNDKGSATQYEEDCAEKDQHCFDGFCIDTECPPNQEFCEDDTTKALCAEDGTSSTPEACPAEHYCDEGETVQCLPWLCTPAQAFCEDNTAKVCNSKGSAIINEIACGDNVCVGGACKPVVCDANTSSCNGKSVMQCDATGTVEQELEVCGDDQYCEEQGANAQCKEQACEPGEKFCGGSKVMLCNANGSDSSEDKDCADDQQGCKDGECVDQICSPNATYCDGNVVKKCSGDGTSSTTLETCGQGQYCGEDGNAAACANQVCTPNSKTCDGTKVMECDEVGAELEEVKDCADDGEGCVDGECVEQVCSSMEVDGNNDYLDITGPVAASLMADSTKFVEMWVYLEKHGNGLFNLGDNHMYGGRTFRLVENASGELGLDVSLVVEFSSLKLPLFEWTYVFAGWDKTEGKYFVGKLQNGELVEQELELPSSNIDSDQCWVGKAISYPNLKGRIDQLRVWDTIPPQELLESSLCNSIASISPPGLVAEWNLGEGEGVVTSDSVQDLDGFLNDGAHWSNDSFLCSGSVCTSGATCGDGQQAPWEECDDGNTEDGDGCSGECILEQACTALSFDGQDDCLTINSDVAPMLVAPFTFETWIWIPDFNSPKFNGFILSATPKAALSLYYSNGDCGAGHVRLKTYTPQGKFTCSDSAVVPGEWNHVASTFYANGDAQLFVGGHASSITKLGYVGGASGLQIGCKQGSSYFFYGALDEVKISSGIAYTTDFVPTVTSEPEPATIGLWHLDEGEGNIAYDSSDHQNHGTLNGPVWTNDAPACVAGATCGDGQQAPWEECDDGNTGDGDGCDSECTVE